MTDSDRERRSFRPSYDRRMRRFSKEMLTSADFREKYNDYRLAFVQPIVAYALKFNVN
jgi:hypothetical protein